MCCVCVLLARIVSPSSRLCLGLSADIKSCWESVLGRFFPSSLSILMVSIDPRQAAGCWLFVADFDCGIKERG